MKLDYVGFAKLRPGRIHILCPGCGRKQSNCYRTEGPGNVPDPPTAVLAHVYCDRHDTGCGGDFTRFLDAEGRFLCGYCGRHDCQDGGKGYRECDEALVNQAVASGLASVCGGPYSAPQHQGVEQSVLDANVLAALEAE